jgi:hypothetical protein
MKRPPYPPRAFALAALFALAPSSLAVSSRAEGALSPARAEELRAIIGGIAVLSADKPEGSSLSIGSDEAVAVLMPKDSPFIQGFEMSIRSPKAAIAAPGGYAYELWRGIAPDPDLKRVSYRGERIIMQSLPARAGYAIQVPTRGDHSLKSGPYAALVPIIVAQRDFPFVLRLVPISKGLPPAAEAAKFQVQVRPILTDFGALSLKLRYPDDGAPVSVAVDDQRIDPSGPVMLKSGSHKLTVSSEAYRDESRGFAIEQGKTLELLIELKDTKPMLSIEAPDSAIVSLDGTRVDHVNKPTMAVDPGEHVAACRLGDYSLTRRFTAQRGKTYRLVLAVELNVEEEEP